MIRTISRSTCTTATSSTSRICCKTARSSPARSLRSPHSFSTACNIATQIIAQVASRTSTAASRISPRAPRAVRAGQPRERSAASVVSRDRRAWRYPADEDQISKMVERRLREEIKPRRADHPVSGRDLADDERSGAVRHRLHVSERGEKRAGKARPRHDYRGGAASSATRASRTKRASGSPRRSRSSSTSCEEDNITPDTRVLLPDASLPQSAPQSASCRTTSPKRR